MRAPVREDNFSRFTRRAYAGQEDSWLLRLLRPASVAKPPQAAPRAAAGGWWRRAWRGEVPGHKSR